MDLLAALALMLVLEGLALAIMARSLPELLAQMREMEPEAVRRTGIAICLAGVVCYLMVRGA